MYEYWIDWKHTVAVRPTVLRAFLAVRALRKTDLASILATDSVRNKRDTLRGCCWCAIDYEPREVQVMI